MNSAQTVTLNSTLSQNWVGCTVRTPRTQVACTLRAQCPCRGHCCAHCKLVARMSHAQPAQVAHSACAGRALSVRRSRAQRAQVARSACAGRTLSVRRSRAQPAQVARLAPRSWVHVATSFPCPAPCQVATSFLGRDLLDD